jgi:hypothetical protein
MTIGDLACGAPGTGRSVYLGMGARDIHYGLRRSRGCRCRIVTCRPHFGEGHV